MKRYILSIAFGFFLFLSFFVSQPALSGSWLLVSSAVAAVWGSITGTLSSQTDLQSAIDAKVSAASPTFTGVVSFPDGSVSAPSITNTGDTNTGISFATADTIDFSVGGVQGPRIDYAAATYPTLYLNPSALNSGLTGFYFSGTTGNRSGIVYNKGTAAPGGVGTAGRFSFYGDGAQDTSVYANEINFSDNALIYSRGGTLKIAGSSAVGGGGGGLTALTTGYVQFDSGIRNANGSASAPTYSFTDDTDTGVYRVAANELGIAAGGTNTGFTFSDDGTFAILKGTYASSAQLKFAHGAGLTVDADEVVGSSAAPPMSGFKQKQVASTTTSITEVQCGSTFVSNSADVMTLPEASTVLGCRLTFVCGTSDDFDINPADGTDEFGPIDEVATGTAAVIDPAAGDAIRCTDIGSTIVIEAVGNDLWVTLGAANGAWSDVN